MSLSSGTSNYPNNFDLFPTSGNPTLIYVIDQERNPVTGMVTVSGTLIRGLQVNSTYTILQAIEQTLGINPQGLFASTVAQRLDDIEASGSQFLSGSFVATDGGLMYGNLTMSGSNILTALSGNANIGSAQYPFNTLFVNNISGVTIGVTGAFVHISGDTMSGDLIIQTRLDVGTANTLFGINTSVFGENNIASGNYSMAQGSGSQSLGLYSHAEGETTLAFSDSSHAEGLNTQSLGSNGSHSEGNNSIASGTSSHAEGNFTIAQGNSAHSEGSSTLAFGDFSHAEGFLGKAYGDYSHVEGINNIASGVLSHAEGLATIAFGQGSHSEGNNSIAYGDFSHVEGPNCIAYGQYSHAQGNTSQASGNTSFAAGTNALALHDYSMVFSDQFGASSTSPDQFLISFQSGVTLTSGTTLTTNQYITTQISGSASAATSTYTVNWNNGSTQKIVFSGVGAGNCAITLSNGIAGSTYALETVNNSASGITVSWANSPRILWQNQVSGTMTSGASSVDLFAFLYDGTTYLGSTTNKYL